MVNFSNTVAGQASEGHNGHIVRMRTNHTLHYDNRTTRQTDADDVSTSFADMLRGAVGRVNNLQVESEGLVQQMIYEPDSVDIHQVMIAGQKAEIALQFTKAIRDEAVRAFRDLINLR